MNSNIKSPKYKLNSYPDIMSLLILLQNKLVIVTLVIVEMS